MPFWSNEEWRARIGSSWCALGGVKPPGKFTATDGKRIGSVQVFTTALTLIVSWALFVDVKHRVLGMLIRLSIYKCATVALFREIQGILTSSGRVLS